MRVHEFISATIWVWVLVCIDVSVAWKSKEETNLTAIVAIMREGGWASDNRGCFYLQNVEYFRVNQSRFFLFDSPQRYDVQMNWTDAKRFCSAMGPNWRLARIEHLTTFRFLAKALEAMYREFQGEAGETGGMYSGHSWKDTFYWIDARFDYHQNLYVDSDNKPIKTTQVLLPRSFRPLGIGAHLGAGKKHYDHNVAIAVGQRKEAVDQCLTFSFPWPNKVEQNKTRYADQFFGFQASFDERPCEAKETFKPLCESQDPECVYYERLDNYNYFNTESNFDGLYSQRDYTDDGLWIFANRRFLVNMKPRNKTEAKAFCESHGTNLYIPRRRAVNSENCLLPYIKFWNRRLTHLHFWTDVVADFGGNPQKTKIQFKNSDGSKVDFEFYNSGNFENNNFNVESSQFTSEKWNPAPPDEEDLKEDRRADGLGANFTIKKRYKDLCLTANWAFEYKEESSCEDLCSWAFITYAVASCGLFMGTICEPKKINPEVHKCDFNPAWINKDAFEEALVKTAVVEFGYKGSNYTRSTYKQQFGEHVCKTPEMKFDYEHTYSNVTYFIIPPKTKTEDLYQYDFTETYWVLNPEKSLDEQWANTGKDVNECWVIQAKRNKEQDKSKGNSDRYKLGILRNANCLEWHFYLCGPESDE